MDKELKARVIKSMEWMVIAMKWETDQNRLNVEEGSQGGYSPELTEAMAVLAELKDDLCKRCESWVWEECTSSIFCLDFSAFREKGE